MFIKFSKGPYRSDRKYVKAVFLGDKLIMEYKNNIIGVARLHSETEKTRDYDVIVAGRCELNAEYIARSIKDMIGRSFKFHNNPVIKRNKYYIEVIDNNMLSVAAKLEFKRI